MTYVVKQIATIRDVAYDINSLWFGKYVTNRYIVNRYDI